MTRKKRLRLARVFLVGNLASIALALALEFLHAPRAAIGISVGPIALTCVGYLIATPGTKRAKQCDT